MSPERSVTYVSERTHNVTGNWALVTTVHNCPIRGTGSQFPLFIEWKPVGWQAFSRGVARLADWLCAWPRPRHCLARRGSNRTGLHTRTEEMASALSRFRRTLAFPESGDRSTVSRRLSSSHARYV